MRTETNSDLALLRLMQLVSPFTKTPNQGAATSVFAAVHEPASALAGRYLADCRPKATTAEVENPDTARRLWEFTEQRLATLQKV